MIGRIVVQNLNETETICLSEFSEIDYKKLNKDIQKYKKKYKKQVLFLEFICFQRFLNTEKIFWIFKRNVVFTRYDTMKIPLN